jgi:hypothetical protein
MALYLKDEETVEEGPPTPPRETLAGEGPSSLSLPTNSEAEAGVGGPDRKEGRADCCFIFSFSLNEELIFVSFNEMNGFSNTSGFSVNLKV